jgi:hypothetical protein
MQQKPGRPRLSREKRRTVVLPVRLSPVEMAGARRCAEIEGLSVAAVVRRALRRDLALRVADLLNQ